MKKFALSAAVFAAMLIFSGCLSVDNSGCLSVDNNSRTCEELANHMMRYTGATLDPRPFVFESVKAENGFGLKLDGQDVVFVKYNTKRKKMRDRLAYVDKNGFLFIAALKIPAIRHGSFVMMDYMRFKPETKKKLLKAFQSFD